MNGSQTETGVRMLWQRLADRDELAARHPENADLSCRTQGDYRHADFAEQGDVAMRVKIRRARSDDLGVIHEIRREAILGIESDDFEAAERQAWANRRSPDFFAERVAAGAVVLAVSGARVLGWGCRSADYISGVSVRPSSGRTGVGRAILARLESELAKRGHECALLDSSPNAVRFYLALGYTPVGPRHDDGAATMSASVAPAALESLELQTASHTPAPSVAMSGAAS